MTNVPFATRRRIFILATVRESSGNVMDGKSITLQGDCVGFNTGNREKLSYSRAEPVQASCFAVA